MKIGTFSSLAKKKEIIETNKKGMFLSFSSFSLRFIFINLENNSNKIAFIVRKKHANSPMRNKLKRRIREIIRTFKFNISVNILIIAKPEIFEYSFDRLQNEILLAFSKLQKLSKKHNFKDCS